MTVVASHTEPTQWQCARCHQPLEPAQIEVSYLGNAYPVELMQCKKCGQVLIPEDLALGKMAQVEQMLEDK